MTRSQEQVAFENELRAFKNEVDTNLREQGDDPGYDAGALRCTIHHANLGRDLLVVMPGMFTVENQPSENGNAAARWRSEDNE